MSRRRPARPEPARRTGWPTLVEEWELREAVGGLRGVIDSGLASTAFLLVYLRRRPPSGAGAGRRRWRRRWCSWSSGWSRKEPVRQALTGVLVVAISAVIARR